MEGNAEKYILITGGAGFVGVNLANRYLELGKSVMVFDNLSRDGVQKNLAWLQNEHPQKLSVKIADIRNRTAVEEAVNNAEIVYHFAAQVAVTSSLIDPFHDFEVNARGTLILLETIRNTPHQPPIIFTSTNKVYGDLHDIVMTATGTRYVPDNEYYASNGISEQRTLDFHSPYGCTKGLADQYMLDYARSFGLKSVVFRMSCIYGPHQFGTEDQGWVAHFLIQALKNKTVTLFGDGKQVRDILYVEDLIDAFLLAEQNIAHISGNAFNIGGGVDNTISLLELVQMIGIIKDQEPDINFDEWRQSDQKYYVSDYSKFSNVTGWVPKANVATGVNALYKWLNTNADLHIRQLANAGKPAMSHQFTRL